MNGYSQLLRYFKQIGQPLVNTMTQGDISNIDLDRKNIFPLLHVSIGDASFPSPQVVRFNVEIACLDIRDINKEINTDKYYGQDNEIDNLNNTLPVLNRIWILMLQDFEENDITASENPTLQQMLLTRKNLLDGWIMTFQVDVPNTDINLCQ
ncbi:MAG TPA: hypothetical protein VL943_00035 [Niabella sp.]|nr:hypothetical protein [Niabella sp.]